MSDPEQNILPPKQRVSKQAALDYLATHEGQLFLRKLKEAAPNKPEETLRARAIAYLRIHPELPKDEIRVINPARLKAAAEHLKWVLQQYPNEPVVQGLYQSLSPLIEAAIADQVIEPVGRQDIPGGYAFSDYVYRPFEDPDVEQAYALFSREMRGGLTEDDKEFLAKMEVYRKSLPTETATEIPTVRNTTAPARMISLAVRYIQSPPMGSPILYQWGGDLGIQFPNGQAAFDGISGNRGIPDDYDRNVFAVKVRGRDYYGELKQAPAANGTDWNLEVVSFGYRVKSDVGMSRLHYRELFTDAEADTIRSLALQLIEVGMYSANQPEALAPTSSGHPRGTRSEALRAPAGSHFLGQVTFNDDWIRTRLPPVQPADMFDWIEFPNGMARFSGGIRGADEKGHDTFCVRVRGKEFYGEIQKSFEENGYDWNISILSFGFGSDKDVEGKSDEVFSMAEVETIRSLITQLVEAGLHYEKKPVVINTVSARSHFLGKINFCDGWIHTRH